MKYRKKPVVIEAIQLKEDNYDEVCSFMEKTPAKKYDSDSSVDEYSNSTYLGVCIDTLEGVMLARYGDYVIKGVNGKFYPCKPDIFEKTYDVIDVVSDQKSKHSAFVEAATPLVKHLCENWHPHVTVIVTPTGAELLEGSEVFVTDKYIVD